MAEAHKRGIIHRDIKPENILLKSSKKEEGGRKVCIADFGIGCLTSDEVHVRQLCGTPGFIDPYLLCALEQGSPGTRPSFTLKSDIFSVGSVFFGLVTGTPLVVGSTTEELLLNNKSLIGTTDALIDKTCTNVSIACRDLLRSMLSGKPTLRPSADQCLRHPWFSSGGLTQ